MSPRVVPKCAYRMQFSLDNYSHRKFSVISNDTITTFPQLFLNFSFCSALLRSSYCKSTPFTWKLTQTGLRIKGKFEMFEPKNLRLGVSAPRFVLYSNSEPEKSHTSQTLIFFWSFRHNMSSLCQTIWILATFGPEKGWSQVLIILEPNEFKQVNLCLFLVIWV